MNRKVTKMSTVIPMSTMTKSKSLGQGVKNIGKKQKTSSQLKSAEAAKIMSSTKPKAKAIMLPEVKVTEPGNNLRKLKRFVSKTTSKRK